MQNKARKDFAAGMIDATPVLLGVMPFAAVSGISAVAVGIPQATAMIMSLSVFAGASQLASYQLIGAEAAPFVIIYTALIINARFVVYSASISTYLQKLPGYAKLIYGYLLTDQGYAISILRFRDGNDVNPHWYYMGVSIPIWFTWQVFSAVGIYFGSVIPGHWGLDFAVPLSFLAVLVGAIEDIDSIVTAAVAGVVTVASASLPMNLDVLVGVMSGLAAGLTVEWYKMRSKRRDKYGQ